MVVPTDHPCSLAVHGRQCIRRATPNHGGGRSRRNAQGSLPVIWSERVRVYEAGDQGRSTIGFGGSLPSGSFIQRFSAEDGGVKDWGSAENFSSGVACLRGGGNFQKLFCCSLRRNEKMEPKAGIEPATRALRMRCSTSELLRRSGLAIYRKLF